MALLARRAYGWVALLAFCASLGAGWAASSHLSPGDDAQCGVVDVAGHPVSQFEAVKTAPVAGHCPYCHLQRVVGGAGLIAQVTGLFQRDRLDDVRPASSPAARSNALDPHTSRGPPAIV